MTRTLAIARGRQALSWSALALALCGQSAGAQRLADEMRLRFPQDSFMRTSWSPMTEAAIAIHDRRPGARDRPAAGGPPGSRLGDQAALWPAYLRGLAYLDQGAAAEADAEFQKILDHKGLLAPTVFHPVAMTLYPLAHAGRARAAARGGAWKTASGLRSAVRARGKMPIRTFPSFAPPDGSTGSSQPRTPCAKGRERMRTGPCAGKYGRWTARVGFRL